MRMFLSCPRIALILILALVPGAAGAALISADDTIFGAGSITRDTAAGLEWLDVPLTGFRSYNDLTGVDGTNEFAPGGDFAGFRLATVAEVRQLWLDAGIRAVDLFGLDANGNTTGTFQTSNATSFNAARALQQLIGFDLTVANPPSQNADGWVTRGITADQFSTDPNARALPSLDTCTVGTGFCGGSSVPLVRAHLNNFGSLNSSASHSWLVRRAPEPGTLALFGLGLAGLGALRRTAR